MLARPVGNRNQTNKLVVARDEHDRASARVERVEPLVDDRRAQLPLLEESMVADHDAPAAATALCAAAVD